MLDSTGIGAYLAGVLNPWRTSVDQRLDTIISLLKEQGVSFMASIQDAKAQLDAAIAQEAAQNAAAFQTLDDAAVANTAATQKVVDDINKLLQEVKAGGQIDVSTELAAIAQNAANAQKAATVIKDAVDSATAAETAADQAVNPSGPSDEQAPAGPQS